MKRYFILFLITIPIFCTAQSLGSERVKKLKASVVRILVDTIPSGTGFFVTADGWIATCWHVIEPAMIRDKKTNRIIDLKKISVEFTTGEKMEVGIQTHLLSEGYEHALGNDYCLLKGIGSTVTKFSFLKVGSYDNIEEGDVIYTAGYPLGIKQHFISSGILSTKWEEKVHLFDYLGHPTKTFIRKVAWLDLTLNRGNSGGPIIKRGKTPAEDEVIGIATFLLNPFAKDAELLANYLSNSAMGGITVGEINYTQVNALYGRAIANNSLGVSGCISINHLVDGSKK